MQDRHTPETWDAIGPTAVGVVAIPRDGKSSGVSVTPVICPDDCPDDLNHDQYYLDCQRIAACVNACVGISNEALEGGALGRLVEAARNALPHFDQLAMPDRLADQHEAELIAALAPFAPPTEAPDGR